MWLYFTLTNLKWNKIFPSVLCYKYPVYIIIIAKTKDDKFAVKQEFYSKILGKIFKRLSMIDTHCIPFRMYIIKVKNWLLQI